MHLNRLGNFSKANSYRIRKKHQSRRLQEKYNIVFNALSTRKCHCPFNVPILMTRIKIPSVRVHIYLFNYLHVALQLQRRISRWWLVVVCPFVCYYFSRKPKDVQMWSRHYCSNYPSDSLLIRVRVLEQCSRRHSHRNQSTLSLLPDHHVIPSIDHLPTAIWHSRSLSVSHW